MDDAELSGAEEDLVAWGLLERGPDGTGWTRRFRGAVMREAGRLSEAERSGAGVPGGPPLAVAIDGALASFPLPPGASLTAAHRRLLFAVELVRLPEPLRRLLGGQ
ncbi:MAG: hypothetical protein ACT4PT_01440 [Methanobacteriota archaeon]